MQPVDIGSDAACKIRLVAPGVAARHARYNAMGHHRFIEVLDESATVQAHGKELRKGNRLRIDYGRFSVGPFEMTFGERHASLPDAVEPVEEVEKGGPRDVTGHTVLFVDDEDAVRSFAARALRLCGYTVLEASGGEAALEIVRSRAEPIDLLITDEVMPNMDGPTLVRAARPLRPEMRIILMGYAEDAFRRNEENAEILHFLPKPFGLKQFVAKIKEVLQGGEPQRERSTATDAGV